MMADPKWNGIPPVGDRPIENKWKFLGMVLLVFIIKLIIWGTNRYITGNVWLFTNADFGREMTYWVGAIAKPVLQLGPVVLLWWFMFKERGNPFRFTKKNLFSSLIFGFIMALIFFFVASFVYFATMNILGYGTDFHFVAGWDEVGWGLVIATMFSFMIGTGPAEEIFSRGFLQDQTARVFPVWQAMVFSAILFAIGHLPISILMYHLPFNVIMWYMAVLVVMGMFFSIIYQWSRNIVFPILIHGLWDWYLTLFAVKGEFSPDFAANAAANFGMIDFINTIVTLAILLPIFYLIYRKFWRRNIISTGSPFDTPKERFYIVRMIKEKDRGDWPRRPVFTTVMVTFIFCILMIPLAGVIGVDDPDLQVDRLEGGGGEVVVVTEEQRDVYGTELQQGEEYEFFLEQENKTVNWLSVNLSWEDEPPAGIRYTNHPDQFRLSVSDGSGNELDSTENSGEFLSLYYKLDEGEEPIDDLTITVKLTRTGDQEPIISIIGLRDIADDSNTYSLDVRYQVTYEITEGSDELNVRW